MKSRALLLTPLMSMLLLVGCSDSDPSSPGSSVGSGAYFPTSKGSTWKYQQKKVGGGGLNYTITAGDSYTANGKTYVKLTNSVSGESGLRYDNGAYYNYDPTKGVELLILKDGATGQTWSFDLTFNGTQNHYEYMISEVGITKTVEGTQYKDVMRVHSTTSLRNPLTGSWQTYNEGDYFYAKNVGLILTDLGPIGQIPLIEYSIK